MDTCRNCQYWGFREMIQKPYGYVGDIPCLRCKRFSEPQDLFTPVNHLEVTIIDNSKDSK